MHSGDRFGIAAVSTTEHAFLAPLTAPCHMFLSAGAKEGEEREGGGVVYSKDRDSVAFFCIFFFLPTEC